MVFLIKGVFMYMRKLSTKKIVYSGFFLALGIVLPFLTGQIPNIGRSLLPMHIPVLICGVVLGWPYGLIVGFITPILRSALLQCHLCIPQLLLWPLSWLHMDVQQAYSTNYFPKGIFTFILLYLFQCFVEELSGVLQA